MICDKDHTTEGLKDTLEALPESQKQPGRHRCTACAFEAGERSGYLVGFRDATALLALHIKELEKAINAMGARIDNRIGPSILAEEEPLKRIGDGLDALKKGGK